MLLVTIILIILLSLALIKVIAKGKFFDCKIKTVEQFHDAIWNNAHEFIFLIDQTSHVVKTNYCTLYKIKELFNTHSSFSNLEVVMDNCFSAVGCL